MSDDSPQSSDATLVAGADEVAHERACHYLIDSDTPDPLRVTTAEPDARVCADTTAWFEKEGAVFDEMALSQVGVALSEALNNLDGTPHVCLDGLPHPEDDADREAVFRFVHAAVSRVRAAGGQCHAHVATDESEVLAYLLEPLFDDVLEVETGDDTVDAAVRSWTDAEAEPTSI